MSKFKVGDKVIRVVGDLEEFSLGDSAEVVMVSGNDLYVTNKKIKSYPFENWIVDQRCCELEKIVHTPLYKALS